LSARPEQCEASFELWEEEYETLSGADNSLANSSGGNSQDECQEDVQKFCKDVGKVRGAVIACLQQHMAELSEACKTELSQQRSDLEQLPRLSA
jgi:hypothetical protein